MRTTGLNDVEAEEMAVVPDMEEWSAMTSVNQHRVEKSCDVIVLDCAPTAESLRFVSMPTTLDWCFQHVFTLLRGLPPPAATLLPPLCRTAAAGSLSVKGRTAPAAT